MSETPSPTRGGARAVDGSDAEKRQVAALSVLAAIALTGMKLVVGLLTGSLGILSEALHSGLDLIAAAMTYFAVRLAGQPADEGHPYGHGKFENLSALFETLLLLGACVWIVVEAVRRLLGEPVEVDPSVWAFLVMGVSIAVDFSRSRALQRAAQKYDSQALEADALHFSTDIWSSLVVVGGLACVLVAERTGLAWLRNADAVAALCVALIVVGVSLRLGRRTLSGLLDEAPAGLVQRIHKRLSELQVQEVGRIRLRKGGATTFVDLSLGVLGDTSVEEGHRLADEAEGAVCELVPGADVTVHVEPAPAAPGSEMTLARQVERVVLSEDRTCQPHDILITRASEGLYLSLHCLVPGNMPVEEAHALTDRLEEALRRHIAGVGRVVIHIEPRSAGAGP
ncbi:MAG: cation-efflux pump [Myxococcales bacterium]|nr:cation-efflux pump [Myxococcales bacterium]